MHTLSKKSNLGRHLLHSGNDRKGPTWQWAVLRSATMACGTGKKTPMGIKNKLAQKTNGWHRDHLVLFVFASGLVRGGTKWIAISPVDFRAGRSELTRVIPSSCHHPPGSFDDNGEGPSVE